MSYILGFLPDNRSRNKVGNVVNQLANIFEGQEINVRWANSGNYHITLHYLGDKLSFINLLLLKRKLGKLPLPHFRISFEKANVGITRSYKELVYLSLDKGGDEVRDMLFRLRTVLKTSDSEKFIPHLTLGRISKDLSSEEYRNLVLDVRNMNSQLDIKNVEFDVSELHLLKFEQGTLEVVHTFMLQ